MIVTDSQVALAGRHAREVRQEKSERLKFWVDGKGDDSVSQASVQAPMDDVLDLSQPAELLLKTAQTGNAERTEESGDSLQLTGKDRLKILLLEKFLGILTGKEVKIKIVDPADLELLSAKEPELNGTGREEQGWGLEYDYHELYQEKERTSFNASGQIKTADGRLIEFSLSMGMSREFIQQHHIQIRAGDAVLVDPLVINFGAGAAELANAKYKFDLNGDGEEDEMSFVGPGSGFLAWDRNSDGMINDGTELFGPSTGNGFTELAAHDKDGNGWIDERDPIYSSLQIWYKDEQGEDRLMDLSQLGIGAIYLEYAATPFSYKDGNNQTQAQLQRTGIYVHDDGRVGSIQQIDFAV